jgi:hypothetical protein
MNGDPKVTSLAYERIELGGGTALASAIDYNGDIELWLLVADGDADTGCAQCATHERLGRLPREWRLRVNLLICNAPTKTGERCTRDVRNPGDHCSAHRESAT